MKHFLMYVTGFVAAIVVIVTVVATIAYLVTATPAESAKGIALSMLNGISTTVGAFIGGLLVLRFKSVREFLQRTIHDRPDVKIAHHLKETLDPWHTRLLKMVGLYKEPTVTPGLRGDGTFGRGSSPDRPCKDCLHWEKHPKTSTGECLVGLTDGTTVSTSPGNTCGRFRPRKFKRADGTT